MSDALNVYTRGTLPDEAVDRSITETKLIFHEEKQ